LDSPFLQDLTQMLETTIPCKDAQEFLTVEEMAQLLRVSKKTIYDLIKLGQIPGCKRVGKQFRFLRSAVLGFFEGQGCVPERERRRS